MLNSDFTCSDNNLCMLKTNAQATNFCMLKAIFAFSKQILHAQKQRILPSQKPKFVHAQPPDKIIKLKYCMLNTRTKFSTARVCMLNTGTKFACSTPEQNSQPRTFACSTTGQNSQRQLFLAQRRKAIIACASDSDCGVSDGVI